MSLSQNGWPYRMSSEMDQQSSHGVQDSETAWSRTTTGSNYRYDLPADPHISKLLVGRHGLAHRKAHTETV